VFLGVVFAFTMYPAAMVTIVALYHWSDNQWVLPSMCEVLRGLTRSNAGTNDDGAWATHSGKRSFLGV